MLARSLAQQALENRKALPGFQPALAARLQVHVAVLGITSGHAGVFPQTPIDDDRLAMQIAAALPAVAILRMRHQEPVADRVIARTEVTQNRRRGREVADEVQRLAAQYFIQHQCPFDLGAQHFAKAPDILGEHACFATKPRCMDHPMQGSKARLRCLQTFR